MTAIKAQGRLLGSPEVTGTTTPHCISETLCQCGDDALSRTSSAQIQSDICDALLESLPPAACCKYGLTVWQEALVWDQMTGTTLTILSDQTVPAWTQASDSQQNVSTSLVCHVYGYLVHRVATLHYISSILVQPVINVPKSSTKICARARYDDIIPISW